MKFRRFAKRQLQPLVASCCAVLVAISLVLPAVAQEQLQLEKDKLAPSSDTGEPVVVVTLGSLNKITEDLNYVTAAVGQPQAAAGFVMITAMFAQGIDMNQPIGVLVNMVDDVPQPTAYLPIADVKSFLKQLEAQTGPTDELDDGTIVASVGPNTIFIKQSGPWTILASQKEQLSNAPADPTNYFTGLGNDYDIAFRVKIQQVPLQARQMLVAQMRQGMEQAAAKQGAEEAQAAREMAEVSLKQIDQFFEEADELMVGLNINEAGHQIEIDTRFTAMPGTEMSALYGGSQAIPSAFASVIRDDAAAYCHSAVSFTPKAIERASTGITNAIGMANKAIDNNEDFSDADRVDLKNLVERLSEVMSDSVKEGKADIGAMVMSGADEFQFALGMFVSDGSEVADIAKDTAAKLKTRFGDDPKFPTFIFDKETYNGVTLHVIETEIPEGEDDRKIFGDKAQIHIGTGPKAVYVAGGKNSLDTMKQLIDSHDKDGGAVRPLGQLKINLLPFFQFAQSMENKDEIAEIISALSIAEEPGVIQLTQDAIPNGQKGEFTISEGVLKVIGAAIQSSNQRRPNNF